MLNFPTWVGGPKSKDKAALASRRLRYLLQRAANELVEEGSIASLSKAISVPRETIYYSVRTGGFSATVAEQIERSVGVDLLPRTWLMYPLEIPTE